MILDDLFTFAEVDPGNRTGGLVGSWSRSVVVDGADDGEDEAED